MLFHKSSKLGSSIIDFHSEKVLWHENNDFSNFSMLKILERPLKHELRMEARGEFFSQPQDVFYFELAMKIENSLFFFRHYNQFSELLSEL